MSKRSKVTSLPGAQSFSLEAEQAVIGGLMLNNEAWPEVAGILTEADFYRADHRLIFRAIQGLARKASPFDVVTLGEMLKARGKLDDAGGFPYLGSLAGNILSAANVVAHARIVKEKSLDRQRIEAAGRHDWAQIIELTRAAEALHNPDTHRRRYQGYTAYELCQEEDEPIQWAVPGILPEGVTILAGKPKVKKSWLALGIAMAVAEGGIALGKVPVEQGTVLYLALEDGRRRLRRRVKAMAPYADAPQRLNFFNDWPRLDAGGIERLDEWITAAESPRLIVVDTLEKVRPVTREGRSLYSNDYVVGEQLAPLVEKHHVAILIVTHVRKMESDDPIDLISGSLGLTASVDGYAVLRKQGGQADAYLYINGRDLEEEMDYALEWDPQTTSWHITGEGDEYRMTPERSEVVTLLQKHGPMTTLEIAQKLHPAKDVHWKSREYNATKQLVHRASQAGQIEQRFDKKWQATVTTVTEEDLGAVTVTEPATTRVSGSTVTTVTTVTPNNTPNELKNEPTNDSNCSNRSNRSDCSNRSNRFNSPFVDPTLEPDP